eukprot:3084848-Pyramimonas_sp.AAC.1
MAFALPSCQKGAEGANPPRTRDIWHGAMMASIPNPRDGGPRCLQTFVLRRRFLPTLYREGVSMGHG